MAGMDLVQWLRAQLDEDERIARAASWTDDANAWHAEPTPFGARDGGQRWYVEDAMDDGVVSHVDPAASDDEGVARHIAEHDPARVLREIAAKRQIVAAYIPPGTSPHPGQPCINYEGQDPTDYDRSDGCSLHIEASKTALHHDYVLRLLALPYSDRPGYREEWRL